MDIGFIKPGLDWSIGFDEHLAHLLDAEGIDDPGEQMRISDVFCRLGLAEHRLFGEEDTATMVFQEHYYAATERMRKLIDRA
ncbi:MAG: hypothetical protein ACREEK_03020 [Bradyrhizobium sp.]